MLRVWTSVLSAAAIVLLFGTTARAGAPKKSDLARVARACGAEATPLRLASAGGLRGHLATANAYSVYMAPDGREVRVGDQAHKRLWMQFLPRKRWS